MDNKIQNKLETLRHNILLKATSISEIQNILSLYYVKGTTITIDKDKWTINEPKD